MGEMVWVHFTPASGLEQGDFDLIVVLTIVRSEKLQNESSPNF